MKKLFAFALLLALCLLLSLAACGSASAPAVSQGKPQTANDAPETEAEAPQAEPETQEPETPADETAEAEGPLRGSIVDGAYENTQLNLRIACPEGWFFYDDAQIAELNNATAELMSGTDVADFFTKNGQFMDAVLASPSGNSINLILQPSQELLDSYSDEQVFTMSEGTFKAQFASAGLELSVYEPLTMQVGGQERTVLHMILSGDADVNEYQIWYRNSDACMGILTIALPDGSDVQPILDGISSLD